MRKTRKIPQLAKVSIQTQISILIGTIFVLFGVALGVAIWSIGQTSSRFSSFVDKDQAELLAYTEMYAQGLQMATALRNVQLEPENKKGFDNFSKAAADFTKALQSAQTLAAGNDKALESLQKIVDLREKQRLLQEKIVGLAAAGDPAPARQLTISQETPLWREIKQLIIDNIDVSKLLATRSKSQVLESAGNAQEFSGFLAAVAIVSGLLLSVFIVRRITRLLRNAVCVAELVAEGKLDTVIEVASRDEVGHLLASLDKMQGKLQTVLKEIDDCGRNMEQSAYQVAAISNEIADVSKQQESQSDDVTNAMQHVHRISRQVQEQAIDAANRSGQVEQLAREGIDNVRQNIDSMEDATRQVGRASSEIQELERFAELIHSIVNVIKEIAGQTNLLALNAAIEAARAGAHGRGFAVVADEVGKLAQRASEAAKEITRLIKDSTARVNEGTKLSDEAQQALVKIDASGKVNMQAIEGIARTAGLLVANTQQVRNLVSELNTLAQQIGGMAGEQGSRREAAQKALAALLEQSQRIGQLVTEANQSASAIGNEMKGIVERTAHMTSLTALQAQRSKKVMEIAQNSAEGARQTVERAGGVVKLSQELQNGSRQLSEQVQQFKIVKREEPITPAAPTHWHAG